MQLTWTYYPKGENQSVTLTVVYVPALDAVDVNGGGYLHAPSNTAFVDWSTYRRFDSVDLKNRQDAFRRLTPISETGIVDSATGSIHMLPFNQ